MEDLLLTPEKNLTDEQKVFLDYYYRLMPVIDTPCVMNKLCHYIEDIDFNIKKKVHSSFGFDYTILQSEGFTPNKAIYEKVYSVMEAHVKKWNDNKKAIKDKTKMEEGFDKVAAYAALQEDLEAISTNDEVIANHLITLFYEDKPSYNKNVLWGIYGKTIYEILKAKTTSVYFPFKNENGSLEFLDEKYSIEKITLTKPDDSTSEKSVEDELDEEMRMFDNIKEDKTFND